VGQAAEAHQVGWIRGLGAGCPNSRDGIEFESSEANIVSSLSDSLPNCQMARENVMKTACRLLSWILLGLSVVLLAGCPKQPAKVNIVLNAANNVNPDAGGQALSVVVRIYQLKDKGRFESADYNAIWKSDKETLSEDLLERQERMIQPGTKEMLEIQTNSQANYIGAVALFRNPSGDSWRKIIPISKNTTQKIGLTLREQTIEIVSGSK
jgi:type VI secretion system protein VasD